MRVDELLEELEGRPDVPVLVYDVEHGRHFEVDSAEFKPVLVRGGAIVLALGSRADVDDD